MTRFTTVPSWFLLAELFLGFGWARAAAEKLFSDSWFSGDDILYFTSEYQDQTVGWFGPVVDHVVIPNSQIVAILVLLLQMGVSTAFVSGRMRRTAIAAATGMNLSFIAAGAVNPSVFYLLLQGILALWLLENVIAEAEAVHVLRTGTIMALLIVVLTVPFITTATPAEVHEDPAAVIVFLGLLAIAASIATRPQETTDS